MNQRRQEQRDTPRDHQPGAAGSEIDLIHEQSEALQAITGYVEAAVKLADKASGEAAESLRDVLARAATQVSRANRALRTFREHLSRSQKRS